MLFSSALFGGFTEQPRLLAQDECYFESIRSFHEHEMPSPDILDFALSKMAKQSGRNCCRRAEPAPPQPPASGAE